MGKTIFQLTETDSFEQIDEGTYRVISSINPYCLSLGRFSTHSVIGKLVGKGRDVLDVGCNEGYLSTVCDPSNQFSGIEMLPLAAAKARTTYIRVVEGDLDRLDDIELSDRFDVLVFADVLEHLKDPLDILRRSCDRWLRPSGRVIISVPNIANWQIRLALLFGNFEYRETGILDRSHLHFYTFRTAQKLVAKADLIPVDVRSGATFFGPLLAVLPFTRGLLATNIIIVAERK